MLGLQYQMSQSGQCQQQKCTFWHLWRLGVGDQGMGRPGFCWDLSPQLTDGCLLGVSSPGPALPWCLCVPVASSYKGTDRFGLGPFLGASFKLNSLFKGPLSKYSQISQILRFWGVGLQHTNFGGHSSAKQRLFISILKLFTSILFSAGLF